jgi:hypothetical protein
MIKALMIDTMLMCDEGTDAERDAYLKLVDEKMQFHTKTNAKYFIVMGINFS